MPFPNDSTSLDDKKQSDADKIEQLRTILVQDKISQAAIEFEQDARRIVANVLAEALHDRNNEDDSVEKTLQPIVNRSIEQSIGHQREEFIGYLYPLVGSMVRKSVTSFLREFIERTNDILENSFTIRGIKWRIDAARSGVSFSEYVATQILEYRVKQVLLIHRETGLMLSSVASVDYDNENADLVSSMLTAINDFVADSFKRDTSNNEQQLDEIKTEHFTLIIKQGPKALLVSAVEGSIPRKISEKFDDAVELIHSIFLKELSHFDGDTTIFSPVEPILTGCLLSEVKSEYQHTNKKPILGWLFFLLLFSVLGWYSFAWWQTHNVANNLMALSEEPGIVVNRSETTGYREINLFLLRDKHAIPIAEWIENNMPNYIDINIKEKSYVSVDLEILQTKVDYLLKKYPSLIASGKNNIVINGELNWDLREQFIFDLQSIPGISALDIDISGINIRSATLDYSQSKEILYELYEQLIGEISRVQINFDNGEANISIDQSHLLNHVSDLFEKAQELSIQLNISSNLIIIGASDAVGDNIFNKQLSLQRANNVKSILISKGLATSSIYAMGVGEINLEGDIMATRKVLFNVMHAKLK